MTEQTEYKEIENNLRAGVSVVMHANQTLKLLEAKVDTVGIATVNNIKNTEQLLEISKENKNDIAEILETNDTFIYHAQQNTNLLDAIMQHQKNEVEQVSNVTENQQSLDASITVQFDNLKQSLANSYERHEQDLKNISENTKSIQTKIGHLDYSQQLNDITQEVTNLTHQIDAHHQLNDEKYANVSKRIDKLDALMTTLMQSAQLYQENQMELSKEITDFNGQLDRIEDNVRKLRVKPALVAQDTIMNLFSNWDVKHPEPVEESITKDEYVSETIDTTESVVEDVLAKGLESEVTEPELEYETLTDITNEPVEEKKGFFQRFLKK